MRVVMTPCTRASARTAIVGIILDPKGPLHMDLVLPMLFYGLPIAAIFAIGAWSVLKNNPRQKAQRDHYRTTYGLSLERMLAESPVDRAEVRRLRNSSKSGEMAAVRYVMEWDPVPLDVAVQFVRAL